MNLCRFTEIGQLAFRQQLTEIRDGAHTGRVRDLLDSKINVCQTNIEISDCCPPFSTKADMVSWLEDVFNKSSIDPDERDAGLWTWLAAYMFESLCPLVGGKRKPLADDHYILNLMNHRRTYRHLVAAPWRLKAAAGIYSKLFLGERPYVHGELMEQGMGRLYLMRIPAVAHAIERLYLDPATGKALRGIMSKVPRSGDFRNRLPARVQQLMLTYDLMSVDVDQFLSLLGDEFTPIT